jgi:PAS domain S-box-containing protein
MTKPQVHVLIVEDDMVDRMACRRALAQDPDYEFVLSEAETGREGLQLAHTQKPDCILLDYHLPDLNGLEFLVELADDTGAIPVPVMMLTGADNAAVAVEAMKRGARDYLIKDVDRQYLELLPAVIQRVLRERWMLTEKKQTEDKLLQAEAKYRSLVEQIPAITYIASLSETNPILYISPQIKKALGFSPEEWLADPELHIRQIHPDDRVRVLDELAQSRLKSKPLRCEYRLLSRVRNVFWFRDEASVVQDESGRSLFLQGILVDITESKRAEEERRAYRNHLEELVEKRTGALEKANQHLRQELIERRRMEDALFQEKERAQEASAQLKVANEKLARLYAEADGQLHQLEESFHATFEQAAVGIAHVAPDGRWLRVNQKLCDIVGYSQEALLRLTFQDITYPDDLSTDLALVDKLLSGELQTFTKEKRYIHRDGHLVWINLTISLVRDESGKPDYFISVIEDIRRRKKAELALKASESALVEAQHLAGVGNWRWNIRADEHTWSEEIYRIYGRDPALPPAIYPEIQKYFTPESWARLAAAIEKGQAQGVSYECDAEVVRPDGSHRWIVACGEATRDASGAVVELHGTVQDITARKQAEDELKFRHALLVTLQETSLDGVLVVDEAAKVLFFNHRYVEMWGILSEVIATRSDELVLKSVLDKVAEPQPFLDKVMSLYAHQQEISQDELALKDGRIFERYSAPVFGDDKKYYGRVWYFRDVTERKLAEQKIIRLDRLYLALSRANEAIARIKDRDTLFKEICDIAVEYGQFKLAWIGITNPDTMGVEVVAYSGPASGYAAGIHVSCDADNPVGRGPTGTSIREDRISICNNFFADPVSLPWRKKAEKYGLRASAACPLKLGGQVVGALALYAGETDYFDQEMANLLTDLSCDISLGLDFLAHEKKHRQAEADVLHQKMFLQQVIDTDPDCIFVKDASGRFLLVNQAMAALHGLAPQDLVGRDGAGLFPSREEAEPHLQADREVIATRRPSVFIAHNFLGGREHWLKVTKVPMEQPDGSVNVLGIAVDISESKQAEETLSTAYKELEKLATHLEVVREEEQKRIAREMHDEMGGVLAALNIKVSLLAVDIPAEMPQLLAEVDSLAKLVADGAKAMRQTVAALRPLLLDEVGLKLALEKYVQEFQQNTGIECDLRLPEAEPALDSTQTAAIFRIVQESLTNVARHAAASRVYITLSEWDGTLLLTVKDNGKGFDPAIRKAKSFGLVGIRERAALVGGKADIISQIGKGTTIRVSIVTKGGIEAPTQGL